MNWKKRFLSLIAAAALGVSMLPAHTAAVSVTYEYGEEMHYLSADPGLPLAEGPAVPIYTAFYEMLTPAAKAIYDGLLANVELTKDGSSVIVFSFPEGVTLDDMGFQMYQDAMNAFNRDHSEVFWLDMSKMKMNASLQPDGLVQCRISPVETHYYTSAYTSREDVERDIQLMESRIDEIVSEAIRYDTMYERLRYAHDWLLEHNVCSGAGLNAPMKAFEAISALDGGVSGTVQPVCEGYARAFDLICRELGVHSILVTGEGKNSGRTEPHMWNQVMLDGIWYAVDVTWDDPTFLENQGGGRHTYFLIGSESICDENMRFRENHVISPQITSYSTAILYPVISANAYEFAGLSSEEEEIPDQLPAEPVEFQRVREYQNGLFADVPEGEWYSTGVADAYAFGFMNGTGDGNFGIRGDVTVVQALTMAVNIHRIYTGNTEELPVTDVWYDAYVDYAFQNNIIRRAYEDYEAPITRGEFAVIFAAALPESAYPVCNDIPDGSVPDIPIKSSYEDAAYLLYRAGILAGNENGEFLPDHQITRAESALIVTRIADESARVRIEKEE